MNSSAHQQGNPMGQHQPPPPPPLPPPEPPQMSSEAQHQHRQDQVVLPQQQQQQQQQQKPPAPILPTTAGLLPVRSLLNEQQVAATLQSRGPSSRANSSSATHANTSRQLLSPSPLSSQEFKNELLARTNQMSTMNSNNNNEASAPSLSIDERLRLRRMEMQQVNGNQLVAPADRQLSVPGPSFKQQQQQQQQGDKRPFAYSPDVNDPNNRGKLDLSQIKSPAMRRRLLANMESSETEEDDDDQQPDDNHREVQLPTSPDPVAASGGRRAVGPQIVYHPNWPAMMIVQPGHAHGHQPANAHHSVMPVDSAAGGSVAVVAAAADDDDNTNRGPGASIIVRYNEPPDFGRRCASYDDAPSRPTRTFTTTTTTTNSSAETERHTGGPSGGARDRYLADLGAEEPEALQSLSMLANDLSRPEKSLGSGPAGGNHIARQQQQQLRQVAQRPRTAATTTKLRTPNDCLRDVDDELSKYHCSNNMTTFLPSASVSTPANGVNIASHRMVNSSSSSSSSNNNNSFANGGDQLCRRQPGYAPAAHGVGLRSSDRLVGGGAASEPVYLLSSPDTSYYFAASGAESGPYTMAPYYGSSLDVEQGQLPTAPNRAPYYRHQPETFFSPAATNSAQRTSHTCQHNRNYSPSSSSLGNNLEARDERAIALREMTPRLQQEVNRLHHKVGGDRY